MTPTKKSVAKKTAFIASQQFILLRIFGKIVSKIMSERNEKSKYMFGRFQETGTSHQRYLAE
jgi:hypothetical protein